MMNEERLDEIRREAERTGRVDAEGIRAGGAPLPGYYNLPLLKEPVWTWEVPLYFFVGGAAGASAVIGAAAQVASAERSLIRDARRIAAIGASLSAPLLIADLGRPKRFLNMLRVFKPQSPMSVGAWLLAGFGLSSTTAILFPRRTGDVAAFASAVFGTGMSTYTGVLIGATSIPVWSKHVTVLPIHFAASAAGSAVSLLELRGHREKALNAIGICAAAFETLTGARIELSDDDASDPLRRGTSGTITRIGGLLSGPVPLLLRTFGSRSRKTRRLAAASTILGSLITRFAWMGAGRISARRAAVPAAAGERPARRPAM